MALIGTIRKKAGVLVVAIIALAILSFIFTDLFSNRDPRPTKIASINGMDISFQEFETASTNAEENMKQQYNVASLTNEFVVIVENLFLVKLKFTIAVTIFFPSHGGFAKIGRIFLTTKYFCKFFHYFLKFQLFYPYPHP